MADNNKKERQAPAAREGGTERLTGSGKLLWPWCQKQEWEGENSLSWECRSSKGSPWVQRLWAQMYSRSSIFPLLRTTLTQLSKNQVSSPSINDCSWDYCYELLCPSPQSRRQLKPTASEPRERNPHCIGLDHWRHFRVLKMAPITHSCVEGFQSYI